MTNAIAVRTSAAQLVELHEAGERARQFIGASTSASTIRAYTSDWSSFTTWCEDHGLESLPATPEAVSYYLAAMSEHLKPATLSRRVAAISQRHQAAGLDSPTHHLAVRKVMTGVRRLHGTVQRRVAPLSVDDLRAICGSYIVDGVKGRRDRALLLVGFAGALRRSEVVALDREDVTFVGEGMVITLRRSKTDQEGSGVEVAIPWGQDSSTCPVRALLAWLTASSITAGPLFRRVDRHGHVGSRRLSAQTVALVVKQYASAIGRDADGFSGHSLRAGLATAAARVGVQERVIATQTRHKSMTVLRRYIRDCDLFRTNAAASLGL